MKKQLELFEETEKTTAEVNTLPIETTIQDVEWCFQFFNNEPIVFAWSDEAAEPLPLTLQIEPIAGQGLHFQQNGMEFKVFPRQISEATKLERQESKANN